MTDCSDAFPTEYCNSLGTSPSQKHSDVSSEGTTGKISPANTPPLGGSPTARSSFLAYKLDCSLASSFTSTEDLLAALSSEPVRLRPCCDSDRLLDSQFCDRDLIAEQLRQKSLLDGIYDAGNGHIWKVAQFSMFPSDCKGSFQHRTRSGDKLQEISEWLQESKRMDSLPEFLVKDASPAAPAFFLDICAGPGTWSDWLLEEIAALDHKRTLAAAAAAAARGGDAAGADAAGAEAAGAKAAGAPTPGLCSESSVATATAVGRRECLSFYGVAARNAAAAPVGGVAGAGVLLPLFTSSPDAAEAAAGTEVVVGDLSCCTSHSVALSEAGALQKDSASAAASSVVAALVQAPSHADDRELVSPAAAAALAPGAATPSEDLGAAVTGSAAAAERLLSCFDAASEGPFYPSCSVSFTAPSPLLPATAAETAAAAADLAVGAAGTVGLTGPTQSSSRAATTAAAASSSFLCCYTSDSHEACVGGHSAYGFGVSLTLHDLLSVGDSRFWHIAREVLEKPNYEGKSSAVHITESENTSASSNSSSDSSASCPYSDRSSSVSSPGNSNDCSRDTSSSERSCFSGSNSSNSSSRSSNNGSDSNERHCKSSSRDRRSSNSSSGNGNRSSRRRTKSRDSNGNTSSSNRLPHLQRCVVGLQKSGNIYNPKNLLFIKQKVENRVHEILEECAAAFGSAEENFNNSSNSTYGSQSAAASPVCGSPSLAHRPFKNASASFPPSSSSSSSNTDNYGVIKLIVADGGITIPKVSVAGQHLENYQELLTGRLLLSELALAFTLLQHGGAFILTVFDAFTPFTASLLYMCAALFEETYIVKPSRNRWTNSERQLVALNFRRLNSINFPGLAAASAEAAKTTRSILSTPALPLDARKAEAGTARRDKDIQPQQQQQQQKKPSSTFLLPRCSRLYTAMRDKLLHVHRVLAEATTVTDYSTVLPETVLPLKLLTSDTAFAESYKEMCVELCRLQCLSLKRTHKKFHELQQNSALLNELRQRQRSLERCMNALKVGATACASSTALGRTPTTAAGTGSQQRKRNCNTAAAAVKPSARNAAHAAFASTLPSSTAAPAGAGTAPAAADVFGNVRRSTTSSSSSGIFEPLPFVLIGLPGSVAACVTAGGHPAEDIWQQSFFPSHMSEHTSPGVAEEEAPTLRAATTACIGDQLQKRHEAEEQCGSGSNTMTHARSAASLHGAADDQPEKREIAQGESVFLSSNSTWRSGSIATPATVSPAVTDDGWWQLVSSSDTNRSSSRLHNGAAGENAGKCSSFVLQQHQKHQKDKQELMQPQQQTVLHPLKTTEVPRPEGLLQPQVCRDGGPQEPQDSNFHVQEGLFDVAGQDDPTTGLYEVTSKSVESEAIALFPAHGGNASKVGGICSSVSTAVPRRTKRIGEVQNSEILQEEHSRAARAAASARVQHSSTGEKQLTHDDEAAAFYTAASLAEEVLASDGGEDKILLSEDFTRKETHERNAAVSSTASASTTDVAASTVVQQQQQRSFARHWQKSSPEQVGQKHLEMQQQQHQHQGKQEGHAQQRKEQEHSQAQNQHKRKDHVAAVRKDPKETEEKRRTVFGSTAADEELSWRRAEYIAWRSCRHSSTTRRRLTVSAVHGPPHSGVHSITTTHFPANSSTQTHHVRRFQLLNNLADTPQVNQGHERRSGGYRSSEDPLRSKRAQTRRHAELYSYKEMTRNKLMLHSSSHANPRENKRSSSATFSSITKTTGVVRTGCLRKISQKMFARSCAEAAQKPNRNTGGFHLCGKRQTKRTRYLGREPTMRGTTSYASGKYGFFQVTDPSSPHSISARTSHGLQYKMQPVDNRKQLTRKLSREGEQTGGQAREGTLCGQSAQHESVQTECKTPQQDQQSANHLVRERSQQPRKAVYSEAHKTQDRNDSQSKDKKTKEGYLDDSDEKKEVAAQGKYVQAQDDGKNGAGVASAQKENGGGAKTQEKVSVARLAAHRVTSRQGTAARCKGRVTAVAGGADVSTASTLVTDAVDVGSVEIDSTPNVSGGAC